MGDGIAALTVTFGVGGLAVLVALTATFTAGFGAGFDSLAGRVSRDSAGFAFTLLLTTFVEALSLFLAGFAAPVALESARTRATLSIVAQPLIPRLRAREASSVLDRSLSEPAVFIGRPLPRAWAPVVGRSN